MMKSLFEQFISSILGEGSTFKAVKLGKGGSTDRVVVFRSKGNMQAAITKGSHIAYNATQHKNLPADSAAPEDETPTKSLALTPGNVKLSVGPGKARAPLAVTSGMVDSAGAPIEIIADLSKSNTRLMDERFRGRGGPGGAVPSYGEARLTAISNEFLQKKSRLSKSQIKKVAREILSQKDSKGWRKAIFGISKQLGYDLPQDESAVIQYLATRKVFEDKELEFLKSDKNSLYYKKGSTGFGGVWPKDPINSSAELMARAWARASYDGAITTLREVQDDSLIDTTKKFIAIQSDPQAGGHDQDILASLQLQLEHAQEKNDTDSIAHYENEILAFESLHFHDTMVVGLDKKDRLTVHHITNKKDNDLLDIWGNTTPARAIANITKIYLSSDENVSPNVLKILEQGVQRCTDSTANTTNLWAEIKLDAEFIDALSDTNMRKYTANLLVWMNKNPRYQAWLKTSDGQKFRNLGTGKVAIGKMAVAMQAYVATSGNKIPYTPVGKIITKLGEFELKKKVPSKSKGLRQCGANKQDEKDIVAAVHHEVVAAIQKADKGKTGPGGENGPHVQAYMASVLHSMHFDVMVKNFDKKLSAVTGIRGTRPEDFRECLADLSGFDAKPKEMNTPRGRERLNQFLVRRCKLNPTDNSIEIVNKSGTHVIAEDTWRTAGTAQKVEKKLGSSLRKCLASKADSRKHARRKGK